MQPKPKTASIELHIELPTEMAVLVNKFVATNQHTRNTDGAMSWERLTTMLLDDVAVATKDNTTWQGGHMSLVFSEHGYRT
jgi:hypothetical protein